MSRIYIRGNFDDFNSYGILATAIAESLIDAGHSVVCIPLEGIAFHDSKWREVKNEKIFNVLAPKTFVPPWELLMIPPPTALRYKHVLSHNVVRLTMFESPRLPEEWVNFENTCMAMILPCEGNIIGFNACGIKIPMYIIPLGYDDSIFKYSAPTDNKCVFGLGGRITQVIDARKGGVAAINVFKKAFPTEKDVELQIKTFPIDQQIYNTEGDSRIKLRREYWNKKQLFDWYKSLTAYVSMSKSEGWGMMQHEAMVIGRPVISTRFLGLKEFAMPEYMYEVDYDVEKAIVNPCNYWPGIWSIPNEQSVINAMRAIYIDRKTAIKKGKLASQHVSKLTWKNTANQILSILNELKLL